MPVRPRQADVIPDPRPALREAEAKLGKGSPGIAGVSGGAPGRTPTQSNDYSQFFKEKHCIQNIILFTDSNRTKGDLVANS